MQVDNSPVTFEEITSVIDGERVELTDDVLEDVARAARFVRRKAESGEPVYGVTTGFGANRDYAIDPDQADTLQRRLILSHASGVGEPLSTEAVRAMMFLRITALAQGNSGVRPDTLELLADMLNEGVHPEVPKMGSVGASGDLCPLAHMCLPLIGEGRAEYGGETFDGDLAMRRAGLEPATLTYKEGLALLNGTQGQTALGILAARRCARVLDAADAIGAMSLEAVAGRRAALQDRIHRLRGRPGQRRSASVIRKMLEGSELAGAPEGTVDGKSEYVQDSYCLRCMPQVHGASRDALDHVVESLVTEANAVTDNPLVFPDETSGGAGDVDDTGSSDTADTDDERADVVSGGNFHGQPVALAVDYLKTASAEIGNISERRCAKLTDRHFSEGLPAFLVDDPGLNSGMMIPQYVAASLVSENKSRASPASTDSIPTSANMEDHVSMGMHAGLHAIDLLDNVSQILGIEYLLAAQALDLRDEFELGRGTKRARDLLREHVSFMEEDRVLSPDIEKAVELVRYGHLTDEIAPLVEELDDN